MFESIKNFLGNLKSKGNTIISTSRASEEFILLRNDFGTVGAEVATIQKVIGRSASSVEGISSANVSVESSSKNAPLKVHFTLELEQNSFQFEVGRKFFCQRCQQRFSFGCER